jgi:poly(ribitol-phosphate) beta-N-acetylglucosaminyltransferase
MPSALHAAPPDVTVIVGAYDAMPYLADCIASVANQSIDPSRVEIVAVDDGSGDGSGAMLDEAAAVTPNLRVIHQANSGNAARPRNVGLDNASGRYVFLLDADDMLGPEALERLVGTADANSSDVVVGRMAPIGRRSVPTSMFTHNQRRANLYRSKVYRTLRVQRLFRREMLERHRMRLPELVLGEDQPFAALAYLNARVISVVADYDCYHLRERDGRNLTVRMADSLRWVATLEYLLPLVASRVPAGRHRDLLMRKHFDDGMREVFGPHFVKHDRSTQVEVVDRVRLLMDAYYTRRVAAGLPALIRFTFDRVAAGDIEGVVAAARARRAGGRAARALTAGMPRPRDFPWPQAIRRLRRRLA